MPRHYNPDALTEATLAEILADWRDMPLLDARQAIALSLERDSALAGCDRLLADLDEKAEGCLP